MAKLKEHGLIPGLGMPAINIDCLGGRNKKDRLVREETTESLVFRWISM
jgi:hypothetical protein